MTWELTVAAIIEREGRFLVVEERDPGYPLPVLNQPAGHVDHGEGILEAVVRETLEETGLAFTPARLVGVYQLRARNGQDYCRVCIAGTVPAAATAAPKDAQILACHWLRPDQIASRGPRSSLVLACIQDHLAGRSFPLDLLQGPVLDR